MSSTKMPKLTAPQRELVESHYWMAKHVLRQLSVFRFALNFAQEEDLNQEAVVGLMLAATKYVPKKGVKFCTFAYKVVKHYLLLAIYKLKWIAQYPSLVIPRCLPSVSHYKKSLWVVEPSYQEHKEYLLRFLAKQIGNMSENKRKIMNQFLVTPTRKAVADQLGLDEHLVGRIVKTEIDRIRLSLIGD